MISERNAGKIPGLFAILLQLIALALIGWYIYLMAMEDSPWAALGFFAGLIVLGSGAGYVIVNPNEAAVATVFGKYVGTIKNDGFWWMNPLSFRKRVSLRIRNFESGKLKVNDKDGNPIEIASVVVWRVVETAEAVFEVDDYRDFVHVQSESAVRSLATSYPYDAHDDAVISLRGNTKEVSEKLRAEVQERLAKAGVEVMEARISHLAYAPEIASAMLRRQQANAIIAARARIVEGAVSMVQMALERIEREGVVKLDEERKAAMVSNLLVVLTSDRDAQPVVNTGTLYQ